MNDKTLTRADLSEAVYDKLGLSRTEAYDLVEDVLEEIISAFENGENVKITSFGSFLLREKNERIGRNPKTGVEVPITPRKVVVFRPSELLKEHVRLQKPLENYWLIISMHDKVLYK